jgi:hypothetical protein
MLPHAVEIAMALPQLKKKSRATKLAAPLRGNRRQLAMTLPPELIARVDAQAAKELRSRTNMIELMLQEGLERRNA